MGNITQAIDLTSLPLQAVLTLVIVLVAMLVFGREEREVK